MLPEQPISYPEFVADQLLTADNLNGLFHYLDAEERGTRVNLIGIGIVCGLELRVNAAGTEVTITKGCGITSQGYLVRWDEKSFQNYKAYDAAREIVYDPFYIGGAQRFDIDELKADASEEGLTKLTPAYLADKVALLFVELLREDAKNCNPESCDDKGRNITLTLRPLLVSRKDAVFLSSGLAGTGVNQAWLSLPEMHMPRHHVPAGDILDSGDVFEGFQSVLSAAFLKELQKNLSNAYKRLSPLLQDRFPSNPFATLSDDFSFINDGSLSVTQMLYLQYYYDLFSDVISAYEEMRKLGLRLLSLCCPDENLFPRHLLLGPAGKSSLPVKTDLRHCFIPSPALGCHGDLVGELRFLFQRLVLLLQRFEVPGSAQSSLSRLNAAGALSTSIARSPIRITPSKLGDFPLSGKAIPYYYNVVGGADTLLDFWNLRRSLNGTATKNLSYHASLYNTKDDAVIHPLQYYLEPFNFLRIEGHVGHSYTDALATINQIRDANRLPFDVVALSADVVSLREQLASIAAGTSKTALRENVQGELSISCHFQDLEALYDTLSQGLLCNLCKEMKYYYDFPLRTSDQPTMLAPEVPLLKTCDPAYRYSSDSLGAAFEAFYKTLPAQYIQPEQFLSGSSINSTTGGLSTNATNNGTAILSYALLYYIEKLSEVLPTTLSGFSIAAFTDRYSDLMAVALRVKQVQQAAGGAAAGNDDELTLGIAEDIVDHLDSLLYACKDAQFIALYNDYKLRWVYLTMLQKFGFYARLHPGFQHKAGVTMGGTFIIVYHERSRVRASTPNIFLSEARATQVRAAQTQAAADTTAKTAATSQPKTQPAAKNAAPEAAIAAPEKTTAQDLKADSTTKLVSDSIRRISVSKLRATLTAKQMSIIDKLFFKDIITRHNLDELTAQLPDKMVIADFYLPYLCCSDCPPVYYIVNETKDEAQPAISIKPTEFCNDDKTVYPVTVTPAGGSISGEGTHTDNGAFSFSPTEVSIAEDALNKVVTLTYTVGDQSASVSVTVFAKPSAAFELKPATAYNVFIFDSTSQRAASLAWDFGDGSTGSGDLVTHIYQQDGTYTVTLTATNGVCSSTASQIITVAKASISINPTTFCSSDQKSYPVTAAPAGGQLSGEGTAADANGGLSFNPAQVAFSGAQASKVIALSYVVQGQSAQQSVTVNRTPSADFSVSAVAGAGDNVKLFTPLNSFPAQYAWDFGDGGKSEETKSAHAFKSPGTYLVTLTASNGNCRSVITRDVQISETQQPAKNCGPLEDILSLFDSLEPDNPDQFKAFVKAFPPYGNVKEFFTKLEGLSGKPVADQLKFFADSKVDDLLAQWFDALNNLILQSDVRLTALAMWRVLQELAMYVMCIQNSDFEKNPINLGPLFSKIEELMKGWTNAVKNFSKDEKLRLQFLLSDLKAEADRVKKNGEDKVKVQYLAKLNSLISMLTNFLK